MAIGDVKEYNGKKYIAVKESGCYGCAFYMFDNGHGDGCSVYKSDMDRNCNEDQSVWEEYEMNDKYLVEDVVDCLIVEKWLVPSDREKAINVINKRIQLISDPDYKTFLKLKEKFKDL